MFRRFLILCALVFLNVSMVKATVYTAASCSAADVQAKINLTANGDTVLVPGGTCTWAIGSVTISSSHQITLNGQGTTTINFASPGTDPGGGNTVFAITAGTSTNTRITGFAFVGAYINGRAPITFNTAFSPLTQTFRFDHNTMTSTSTPAAITFIIINGNGPGLLDHNTISGDFGASEFIHNMGEGAGNSTSWAEDVVPGGPINIFFEDNTFTYLTAGGNFFGTELVNHQGARAVFRYNTLNMVQIDVHGDHPSTCGTVNGRWFEFYNNTFHTTGTNPNQSQYMAIGGGSGVIFNNVHPSTDPTNQGAGNVELRNNCGTGGYPILDQVGLGINQHASPVYAWNNTNMPIVSSSSYIQLNRDYFLSASQPATITRCQSAADVTAGCPVSYAYTPYTYPHPLNFSGTPTLSLSPSPLNFGNQNTGTTSGASTVTVTNSTANNAVLGSPNFYSITGTNLSDFARAGGTCTAAQVLAPAGTCTITVTFSPGAAGTRAARLNLIGTVSGSTDLNGTGIVPGGGGGGAVNKVNLATEVKGILPVPNGGLALSTVANHQTPVGTGTDVYTAKTLPDCPDTAGNHINFTQSSNSYSCGVSGSFVPISGAPNLVYATSISSGASNLVQQNHTPTVGSPTSVAFLSNVGAGHMLIGAYAAQGDSGRVVSSTAGDTWSHALTQNASNVAFDIFYTCNAVGGADTVNITNLTGYALVHIYEFSGNPTSSCLDTTGFTAHSPGGGAENSTTATTSGSVAQTTELVFAFFGQDTGGTLTTASASGAFTNLQLDTSNTAFNSVARSAVGNVTTGLSGTQSVTFTNDSSGGAGGIVAGIATFKLSTTGSAAASLRPLVPGDLLSGFTLSFGSLGTPANGTIVYCPDCTIANPCAGSGTGAIAKRLNSVWVCN